MINSICHKCQKSFSFSPSHKRKFCSRECSAKGRAFPRPKRKAANCQICEKEFEYLESNGATGKYCSRQCGYAARKLRPSPKRRIETYHSGYRYIYSDDGRRIGEHRLVMEKVLGRKLKSCEHVHHIDGDKLNNSPDNLAVLSVSEHSRITLNTDDAKWVKYRSTRGALGILRSYGYTAAEVAAMYVNPPSPPC